MGIYWKYQSSPAGAGRPYNQGLLSRRQRSALARLSRERSSYGSGNSLRNVLRHKIRRDEVDPMNESARYRRTITKGWNCGKETRDRADIQPDLTNVEREHYR